MLFLIASNYAIAQHQFKYELEFKRDSLNKDFVLKEIFNLDYMDGESVFYPAVYSKIDSLYKAQANVNIKELPFANADYYIQKSLSKEEIVFDEIIGFDRYRTLDDKDLDWVITNETKIFTSDLEKEYKLNKATILFGGREWHAWYSLEIPVSDGPYKFWGLPGLIFEIYDVEEDYSFKLISIRNIDEIFNADVLSKVGVKSRQVEYAKFLELHQEFADDPGVFYKRFVQQFGITPSAVEVRDYADNMKKRRLKNNNPIEFY